MSALVELGPFRFDRKRRVLLRDGTAVAIPRRALDLLCALAEAAGEMVSKDDLVAALWPGETVEEHNLAKLVFLLRRVLGERDDGRAWIETIPKRGYRLAVSHPATESHAGRPAPGPPTEAPTPRHFSFGGFQVDAAQKLLRRNGVIQPLAPKLVDTLVALVERHGDLVTRDELFATVWKDVAVADGSLTQAVWLLRRCLEVDGARVIETVPRRGYRFIAPVRTAERAESVDPAPQRPAAGRPSARRLIGREPDLAAVGELLDRSDVSLVTIHGTAGSGKTSLALALLQRRAAAGARGDVFVDLSALRDPEAMPGEVARALGVEEDLYRATPELVAEHLAERDALLVLDNFEQLLPAAAALGRWVEAAPRLKLLVTSQRLLRLRAEHAYRLAPLPTPTSDTPLGEIAKTHAVALFVERSRAQRADFVLGPENARDIAAICARLDGLPLAIELAAARSRLIGPAALLAQLDRPLALLRGGPLDAPERQQSLRQALDWSHGLLAERERALFRGLSVFAGSFTLEAIESVVGLDSLDELEALVDASLVEVVPEAMPPRFRLLAPVRDYAREALASSASQGELARRHAEHYVGVAEAGAAAIPTARQVAVLGELALDVDNFRAARETLGRTDPELRLRLAAALGPFWHMRGYWLEAREELGAALAGALGAPAADRSAAMLHLGRLNFFLGDEDAARDQFEEGLAAALDARDPVLVARALTARAQGRLKVGDDAEARRDLEQAMPAALSSGDAVALAEAAIASGAFAAGVGDYAAARRFLAQGLEAARKARSGALVAQALYYSCGVALLSGEVSEARRQGENARAAAPAAGDASWAHHLTEMYARSLLAVRKWNEAAPLIRASLAAIEAGGSRTCLPHGIEAVARLAAARGQQDDAVRLLGAVEGICQTFGIAMLPLERRLYRQSVELLAPDPDELWQEGRSWSPAEATRRALAICAAAS